MSKEGRFHFAKPWLACALRWPNGEEELPVLIYYTKEPIVCVKAVEAKNIVFAAAVRLNPDIDPREVEVYTVPFSPYLDG